MSKSEELNRIKKIYGEECMHLCRKFFPTILEEDGKLLEILTDTFAYNIKTLGEDILNNCLENDFRKFIYSKYKVDKVEDEIIDDRSPYEILDEAGYDLVECKTEEEIQKFKKYYEPGEELCTFVENRLKRCIVFFAIKKDVDNIRREDFKEPKRQDKYGTSVMSIQFERQGDCIVSIKNRYNHKVKKPDATYGNDLNGIAPGLRGSFTRLLKERNLELNSKNIEKFEIPNYTVAKDGKYYKYNKIDKDIYYCPGNIIIESGNVRKIDENEMLIESFILNLKENTIRNNEQQKKDGFLDTFNDEKTKIKKVQIQKNKEEHTKSIMIYQKDLEYPVTITIDRNNQIVKYKNLNLTRIEDNFMMNNEKLIQLELPNVTEVGKSFLENNVQLSKLELSNLNTVGDSFLKSNRSISYLELPKLIKTGNDFLMSNVELEELELPTLREVGESFLLQNEKLRKLEVPGLEKVGVGFLMYNTGLDELRLPNLIQANNNFVMNNGWITQLDLPNVQKIGNKFLYWNKGIKQLEFPNLVETGNEFLYQNENLEQLVSPKLEKVGNSFLFNNVKMTKFETADDIKKGYDFLYKNKVIKENMEVQDKLNEEVEIKINSSDIAKLTKKKNILSEKVENIARFFKEKIRKMEEKNNDRV